MPDEVIPPRVLRPMMIRNLVPTLPERGKLKIGAKGAMRQSRNGNEFQPPQKLDHFVITTLERGADGNFKRDEAMHARYGDKPKLLPVRLLYDDPVLNFPTRYAAFKGRTLWCSGDGEQAMRLSDDGKSHQAVACPCPRQEQGYKGPDKCKMNGVLSVLLDGAGGVGGVWKFRTTSFNSVVGLASSMSFIRTVTGGPLANIPLQLHVSPKQVTDPDGRQQTVYVVGLTFNGDMDQLQLKGREIALERAKVHVSIEHIEEEARRVLALAPPVNAPLPGDDASDIVEEFYPEQVDTGPADPPPARPTRDQFLETLRTGGDIAQEETQETRPRPPADEEEEGDEAADLGVEEPPTFDVQTPDGESRSFPVAWDAVKVLAHCMTEQARVNQAALDGVWGDNGLLLTQLRERGEAKHAEDLHMHYRKLTEALDKPKPAPAADAPRDWVTWRTKVGKDIDAVKTAGEYTALKQRLAALLPGYAEANPGGHEKLVKYLRAMDTYFGLDGTHG
jgi:Recombination directionality factor-like